MRSVFDVMLGLGEGVWGWMWVSAILRRCCVSEYLFSLSALVDVEMSEERKCLFFWLSRREETTIRSVVEG